MNGFECDGRVLLVFYGMNMKLERPRRGNASFLLSGSKDQAVELLNQSNEVTS